MYTHTHKIFPVLDSPGSPHLACLKPAETQAVATQDERWRIAWSRSQQGSVCVHWLTCALSNGLKPCSHTLCSATIEVLWLIICKCLFCSLGLDTGGQKSSSIFLEKIKRRVEIVELLISVEISSLDLAQDNILIKDLFYSGRTCQSF